jgi:hypothetical protein
MTEGHDAEAGKPGEFHIKIDRVEYRVAEEELTGAQLRRLPNPPIGPDRDLFEVIPVRRTARSTTATSSRSLTASASSLRLRTSTPAAASRTTTRSRQMTLPEPDAEFLARRGLAHAVAVDCPMTCVMLQDWRLPQGLNVTTADLLIRLQPGYPDLPPDMWWFSPAVTRANGGAIEATQVSENYLGRTRYRSLPLPSRPAQRPVPL